ncbi:MAG: hypothetical protein IPJ84_11970 [Bdellovibrionales bacterium]|nr:hypothetical protein [Bdellovibrionales bacterium]
MKLHHAILNALLALLCFNSSPAVSSENSIAPGLYQISGTHSHLGPYNGYLLVKDSSEVQRAISLHSLDSAQKRKIGLQKDQNFSIEQLWEGNNTPKGALFQIRASNVLTTYNDFTATSDDLSIETIALGRADTSFHVKNDGTYIEHYTLISKNDPAQKTPDLFPKDSRTRLDASGTSGSILINLAGWIGINRAIHEYRKLKQFDPYRDREEFKNNSVFHIKDFTDLEFYRDQSSKLRIRNKSLTPLSIAEALQRRAAFQPTLTEKAEFKKQQTLSVMNDFGIFEVGTADSNGRIVALQPQGDTALWFGVYIWALSLEHDVTQSADSYQRLRNAIEGMNHLVEISPDPKLFARYIHKSPANEPVTDPYVRQGSGKYRDYKYDSRSNNDMVKGLLLGYVIAYKSLKAEDHELKQKTASLVRRIQQLDPIRKKTGNNAAAKGLDALWNEDNESLREYIANSDSLTSRVSEKLYIDSGFHIGGMTNPSGIHLNLISQSIRYYLAEALIKKANEAGERMFIHRPATETAPESDESPLPRLEAIKQSASNNIKNLSLRMQKAYFNYLNIAAYAITREPDLKQRAVDSVWGLIEVPLVRSVGQLRGDLQLQPDWMYSTWPFEPWTALKGPWIINKEKLASKNQQRGMLGYPMFECAALGSTYLWVSDTSDFPCSGNPNIISFSADYLWAYWLARSADIISERD